MLGKKGNDADERRDHVPKLPVSPASDGVARSAARLSFRLSKVLYLGAVVVVSMSSCLALGLVMRGARGSLPFFLRCEADQESELIQSDAIEPPDFTRSRNAMIEAVVVAGGLNANGGCDGTVRQRCTPTGAIGDDVCHFSA
jgi:hypothetical protein